MVKLFLLMLLCHIVDDFCLQSFCLSKLKQKSFWAVYDDKYRNDWVPALILHALEWAIMIHIPVFLMLPETPGFYLCLSILLNTVTHAVIDHLKCNKFILNLIEDQSVHFFQVVLTFCIFTFLI